MDTDLTSDIKTLLEKYETLNNNYQSLVLENAKLRADVGQLQNKIDTLKAQMSDKVPKVVISELESKISSHTKALDVTAKKMFEMQNNLNTYTQQPISHAFVEAIRKQVLEEVMANTKTLIELQTDNITKMMDTKIIETKQSICNAKRFMFAK